MEITSFLSSEVWNILSAHFRARKAVRISAENYRAASSPLTWSDSQLEAVLRFAALFGPTAFRVVTQGKPVRPMTYRDRSGWIRWEAIEQLRSARASLNLTRVEDYSNTILAFARALEASVQCPVQINFYGTPGEAQGLGAHSDAHDVLVYQLRGRKNWNVEGIGAQIASGDDITLHPGDWLFVPHGVRHEVRNLNPEPTAHLAFGFHPLAWGDFWQTILETARRTIPALSDAIDPTLASAAVAQRLAADLLPALSVADPVAAHRQHLNSFRNFAVAVPRADAVDPQTLECADITTTFFWQQPTATARRAAEFFEVDLPYRRVPLALRPDLEPSVRFMMSVTSFRPADVPALEAPAALLLCRLLAGIGALRMAP